MSGLSFCKKPGQKAWVVFSGETDLPWLKFLRPGFRHCFVLLHDGMHWITLDPLSHYTDVSVHHIPSHFDLPSWLKGRGQNVVPAKIDQKHCKPAPCMPFTCVEAVKRVLGLHKRFIFTPWQLYRHLTTNTKTVIPAASPAAQGELKRRGFLTLNIVKAIDLCARRKARSVETPYVSAAATTHRGQLEKL